MLSKFEQTSKKIGTPRNVSAITIYNFAHKKEPKGHKLDFEMSCDFFLFPTGKRDLKGRRFESPQTALGVAETAFNRLCAKRISTRI